MKIKKKKETSCVKCFLFPLNAPIVAKKKNQMRNEFLRLYHTIEMRLHIRYSWIFMPEAIAARAHCNQITILLRHQP